MTKFLINLELAPGEDHSAFFEKLVEMQVRELLGQIIPVKPHGNEGGPTRVFVVTADRSEYNEVGQIALDILAFPDVMSFKPHEVVPMMRGSWSDRKRPRPKLPAPEPRT